MGLLGCGVFIFLSLVCQECVKIADAPARRNIPKDRHIDDFSDTRIDVPARSAASEATDASRDTSSSECTDVAPSVGAALLSGDKDGRGFDAARNVEHVWTHDRRIHLGHS